MAKSRFNLKFTLSSFQTLEGDAQTSGNTAQSACAVTWAWSVAQHPTAVPWAGPEGLLHLYLLCKKLKRKSQSFSPPEAEGTSLCGVGFTAGGTIAVVCGCKKQRGSGRACPPPGWWPLRSSAGVCCSEGLLGLPADACCVGRSPSSQDRRQPHNGVQLAVYPEKSFWDRVRAPGSRGQYISGTWGVCIKSGMFTTSAGFGADWSVGHECMKCNG